MGHHGPPDHNFVVIAQMVIKYGTANKIVTKVFVTSPLLCDKNFIKSLHFILAQSGTSIEFRPLALKLLLSSPE